MVDPVWGVARQGDSLMAMTARPTPAQGFEREVHVMADLQWRADVQAVGLGVALAVMFVWRMVAGVLS